MSTMKKEKCRDAMQRIMAHSPGGAREAGAVAEATISTWHQVADILVPVIGKRGFDVIFRRSLHLTGRALPWFAIAGDHEDNAALLEALRECLAGRSTDEAAEGSCFLLETFTELLAALVGESLAERFLSPAWAPLSPSYKEETRS